MEEAIHLLTENATRIFPGGPVSGVRRIMDRLRPLSYLVWLELTFPAASKRVVVKIPRAVGTNGSEEVRKTMDRMVKEFENTKALHGKFSFQEGLGVVHPLAVFSDIPAIILEAVEGTNLRDLIEERATWFPRPSTMEQLKYACMKAGSWLNVLQAQTQIPNGVFQFDTMVEYIDVRLRRIVEYQPYGISQKERTDVLESIRKEGRHLNPSDLSIAAVHGDFCPSNVMVAQDKLVVIDCSAVQTGSVFHDVTRFYHQLGLFLWKPSFRPSVISKMQEAFLSGYGLGIRTDSALFRLFMIQHIVCHWLGRLKASESVKVRSAYLKWISFSHRRELRQFLAGTL